MRTYVALFLLFWVCVTNAEVAQPLDKVVAIINDDVITSHELDAQVEELRNQLMAKHVTLPTESALRKQVLQHLIDVNLQLQMAKHNDISIDGTELDQTIEKIATDNKLTVTQLREAIEREGFQWNEYRENLRKELTIGRIQQRSVSHEVVVSAQQVNDYLKTSQHDVGTKRTYRVQNIVIPLPEAPTTAQVNKAYDKAKNLLKKIREGSDFGMIALAESSGEYALEGGDLGDRHLGELPEVFAKEVQHMQVGQVSGPIRTGNGLQLIKLASMDDNKTHHQVSKTHARHILIKQDANMTADDARRQINNLYEQLKSGKDFSRMAKQYSLDAASAVNGGDLGWVTPDELVPAFAQAMEALPLHTISKPVQTPFGWHLIEVLERKTEDDSELYERQQVLKQLQQRKFSEAVKNWQQHLRADAYIKVLDKDLA